MSENSGRFERLNAEEPVLTRVRPDVVFAKYPFYFEGSDGPELVNVYEVKMGKLTEFGIRFSSQGEYCLRLAESIQNDEGGLICAMNCNFGLVADDYDRLPPDVSYNLRIDNHRVVQLPVADKTALLIDDRGRLTLSPRVAHGHLTVGDYRAPWRGSLSKQPARASELDSAITVFSPFNRPILVSPDPETGTRRRFKSGHETIPRIDGHFEAVIDSSGKHPVIAAIEEAGSSHIFDGHMIFRFPSSLRRHLHVGDYVTEATLDGQNLQDFRYGATVGAILTRDPFWTQSSIAHSEIVQTRVAENGAAVYDGAGKFARACIVLTPTAVTFVLIDARRRVRGQEGMTIRELLSFLAQRFPDYEQAVNVDGGHAGKLVVARDMRFEVFGNLHFKRWPEPGSPKMRWDGLLGARLPSVIYARC